MSESYLFLECAGQRLALPAQQVREVIRAVKITQFPQSNPAVAGVISLRGKVTPVISSAPLLGAEVAPIHPSQYFVILENSTQPVALVVDKVHDLGFLGKNLPGNTIATLPADQLVQNIADTPDGMVIIINTDYIVRLLDETELPDVNSPGRLE